MQSRNQGQALLFEAMAYALAGMFLLAGLVNKTTTLMVFGWVFMGFAVSLIVASFINKPILKGRWVGFIQWVQNILSLLLFFVTFVEFVSESVKPQKDLYVVLMYAFLVLLFFGIVIEFGRTVVPFHRNRGKQPNINS